MTRIIIEVDPPRAYWEDSPDVQFWGDTTVSALRALNRDGWIKHHARVAERDRAFKRIKHHFRRSQGIAMWWPRRWFTKAQEEAASRHADLVERIAKELDERGDGSWAELANLVNQEWKG